MNLLHDHQTLSRIQAHMCIVDIDKIYKRKCKMFRLCACALMSVEFVVSFPFQPVIAELLDKFRWNARKTGLQFDIIHKRNQSHFMSDKQC